MRLLTRRVNKFTRLMHTSVCVKNIHDTYAMHRRTGDVVRGGGGAETNNLPE